MEHKDDLARMDADMQDLLSSMKNGMGEVFVKVKDIIEVKTRKNMVEMNRLTQAQQTEMMSMKSMWEMERNGLQDKLRKVEEELVMVKDESKQLMKMFMQYESVEGGGEGRDVRMDRKASTPAKNDNIVEKLLRFVNFPEDKVGMIVEMGGGGQEEDSEVRSGEEIVREFLKLTKFPKDMLEEMVKQFIQAEEG
jgi:hypothetical protein